MIHPTILLAAALQFRPNAERHEIAERSGVPVGIINKAAGRRPISANHLLRLCAAIGLDPMTGQSIERRQAADIDRNALAIAIKLTMKLRGHSQRKAAESVNTTNTTWHRLINEAPVTIDSVLAGTRYVGRHPFDYLIPADVSRETNGETSSRSNNQEAA